MCPSAASPWIEDGGPNTFFAQHYAMPSGTSTNMEPIGLRFDPEAVQSNQRFLELGGNFLPNASFRTASTVDSQTILMTEMDRIQQGSFGRAAQGAGRGVITPEAQLFTDGLSSLGGFVGGPRIRSIWAKAFTAAAAPPCFITSLSTVTSS